MRNIININENWKFIQEDAGLPSVYPENWQTVDVPHSWNAVDGCDGNGSYDRGQYWYAKTFETPVQPLAGGRVFVEFMGVNSEATVYVNGEKTEKSAKIDISGLDKLIFKVEAEDSRYYDEYVYEINRYSRDTLSVETPLFAGNSMTVNISSDSNTLDIRGTVLVALYEKESGRMKWCESREILNGQKQLTLTFTDLPDYAEDMELRVFVWKDLKTLQPIFKQKT